MPKSVAKDAYGDDIVDSAAMAAYEAECARNTAELGWGTGTAGTGSRSSDWALRFARLGVRCCERIASRRPTAEQAMTELQAIKMQMQHARVGKLGHHGHGVHAGGGSGENGSGGGYSGSHSGPVSEAMSVQSSNFDTSLSNGIPSDSMISTASSTHSVASAASTSTASGDRFCIKCGSVQPATAPG